MRNRSRGGTADYLCAIDEVVHRAVATAVSDGLGSCVGVVTGGRGAGVDEPVDAPQMLTDLAESYDVSVRADAAGGLDAELHKEVWRLLERVVECDRLAYREAAEVGDLRPRECERGL